MLTPQMTWKCGEYCWYVFTIMVNLTFTLLTPELGEGSAKLQLIENTHRGHVLLRSLSTSLRVSAHCSWPLALWSLCFATWAHIYVFNAMRIGHFSLHRCDRNWPTTISTFNTFNCLLIVCYFRRSGRSLPPSVILICYAQSARMQLHDDYRNIQHRNFFP